MSTASGTPGPEVDTQPGKEMDLSRVTQHENLVGRERKTNRACKDSWAKHGTEHMGRAGKDEQHILRARHWYMGKTEPFCGGPALKHTQVFK